MYAITRRALPVVGLFVLGAAIVPVTHSQSGVEVRLDQAEKRLDDLKELPKQVAVLSEDVKQWREEERQSRDRTSTIETGLMLACATVLLERLGAALGFRIGKGSKE
jgi:outer membrane murein-binding lipoprotein Lpp